MCFYRTLKMLKIGGQSHSRRIEHEPEAPAAFHQEEDDRQWR